MFTLELSSKKKKLYHYYGFITTSIGERYLSQKTVHVRCMEVAIDLERFMEVVL